MREYTGFLGFLYDWQGLIGTVIAVVAIGIGGALALDQIDLMKRQMKEDRDARQAPITNLEVSLARAHTLFAQSVERALWEVRRQSHALGEGRELPPGYEPKIPDTETDAEVGQAVRAIATQVGWAAINPRLRHYHDTLKVELAILAENVAPPVRSHEGIIANRVARIEALLNDNRAYIFETSGMSSADLHVEIRRRIAD